MGCLSFIGVCAPIEAVNGTCTQMELPKPNSEQLNKFVKGWAERAIYGVLYANQDKFVTMAFVRETMGVESGQQEHLNRRLRELYPYFEFEKKREGEEFLYRIVAMKPGALEPKSPISKADRAWVLRDKRCAQCGRTPSEDKVKLHVDHIIPQDWNGTNDRENLQALCSECNEGKKNLFSSFDEHADKIKKAANYNEPHKRIGELLKAFGEEPVPSDLLELVAKAKQYQDDWQKRMRELRVLGWDIVPSKKKEGNRVRSYYQLKRWEAWPEGSIRAEISKRELAKKQAQQG